MTGDEMKAIRHEIKLTALQLGRAFGYEGTPASTAMAIRRFESGGRAIPPAISRLLIMFQKWEVPYGWTDEPPPPEPSPSELDDFELDDTNTQGDD